MFVTRGSGLGPTGDEILKQVDKNLEPGDLEMYRKIINIEPSGDKKEFVLWFLRKDKDKVVTLFVAPASEEGRATLRLGDNMWLYIPNVGKPIRITSMQSVVGGVFNNADYHAPGLRRGIQRGQAGRGPRSNIFWISKPKPMPWPTTASRCGC